MITGHQFRAFDSDIFLAIVDPSQHLDPIFQEIETHAKRFEMRFSRFLDTSELCTINQHTGHEISISEEMEKILAAAQHAYQFTHGLFDPTVLVSLQGIGYDKSFPDLSASRPYSREQVASEFRKKGSFSAVQLDTIRHTLSLPAGTGIDLGGIAKGYWVDQTEQYLEKYFQNFWISAGGDVYLKGSNEREIPWELGVQNPLDHQVDRVTLKLPNRGIGVATSGTTKRKGASWHHIIDPRTGLPTDNTILAVTVLANTTTEADIMAKTTLILGIEEGLAYIDTLPDYACIIIDQDLKIHLSITMKKFL